MSKVDRRGFLKAFIGRKKTKIYPPYSKNEEDFKNCQDCNDMPCIDACKESIITIIGETPTIFFKNSGCSYCDECAKACKMGVLSVENKKQIDAVFSIDTTKCLAWNGIICSSCKDFCQEAAIDFFNLFRPIVNEKCTSCGFCVAPCAVNAFDIKESL